MTDELRELLDDLDEYFGNRADIDNDGGPNVAMRFQARVQEARRTILVTESADRMMVKHAQSLARLARS